MKRGFVFAAFFTLLFALPQLVSGMDVVKETRNVKDFTRVAFGVPGNLYISIGPVFKVELEGEKSLLDEIETEVTGNKLVIKKENFRWVNNEKVNVYITMPELNGLGVSGSGKAEVKDKVKTGKLDLNVSGSGKLYTSDVDVTDLNCGISGSGDVIVSGKGSAGSATISISGSGNYTGEALVIGSADISISGSGNCSCNVSGNLEASVSGSGNVTYSGNPKVDARVSGSGKVRSR